MVIVDSSVWIDLIKGRETSEVRAFVRLAKEKEIALGDLILYEVLRGVSPPDQFEKVKAHLLGFSVFTMAGRDLALEAVDNTRALRKLGVQVNTVDCLIATFCLISGSRLLSSDHHFQPFVEHLGLVMAG